jgi:hypothetical protein
MSFKSSNVDGAKMDKEGLKKHGVMDEEQKSILLEQPIPLYNNQPPQPTTRAEGDQASGVVVQILPSHAKGIPR